MRRGVDAQHEVRCVACGSVIARSSAREYDRYGNRWEREQKRFEYLCKPCHRRECHLPRDKLEAALSSVGSHHDSPAAFVDAYYRHVERTTTSRDGGFG